jgi:ferredoxin-like protein FixX
MSLVGIKKCSTYGENEIAESLNDLLVGFDKEKIRNKKILIFFDFPLPDISIVKGAVGVLRECGADSITAGTTLFSEELPKDYKGFFSSEKIEFIDFKHNNYEQIDIPYRKDKMPEHFRGFAILSPVQYGQEKAIEKMSSMKIRVLRKIFLPVAFTDADYILPIVKMKDSPVLKIGGFVNSMFSLLPTLTRSEIFLYLLSYKMHDAILEAFSLVKEKVLFGLVDGVKANLSDSEEINDMKVLLLSEDLLSLDAVVSVLVGFRSSEVETNKLGDMYDVGKGVLSNITLFGDDFTEFRKEAVKKLRNYSAFERKRETLKIERQDIPTLEDISIYCPTGAIEKQKEKEFVINKQKCIKCNFCIAISKGCVSAE